MNSYISESFLFLFLRNVAHLVQSQITFICISTDVWQSTSGIAVVGGSVSHYAVL